MILRGRKYDKLAREVAIKTGLDYDNVYIAPTYRIRENEVLRELKEAKYGIMLIFDPKVEIDQKTIKRYYFLKERVKEMFVFIPDSIKLDEKNKNVEVIKYKSNDYNDLINKLEFLLNELKNKSIRKKQDEISILLLLLIALIVSLLITSKSSK